MEHVIIFGGTGMLAGATKWLMENADCISITGRDERKFNELKTSSNDNDHRFVTLDYSNNEDLKKFLNESIQENGPIDMVVSWIHSTASDAIPIIFEEIYRKQKDQWRFIHIKGSSHDLSSIENEFMVPENCIYRQILLGFKVENDISRWLSHDEISNGVIAAIQHDDKKSIIGVLDPWENRP